MKRRNFLWTAFLFIAFHPARAQPGRSLKECIEYGLQHHNSNTVFANDRLTAQAKTREINSAYLPAVNGTVAFDNNLKVQQSVIPAGTLAPEERRIAFTQKFALNGSLQIDQAIFDKAAITAIKAGKHHQAKAELNQELNQEAIIYNICSAYYQIFVYGEQLHLLRENLANYQQQINVSKQGVEKGVVIEADLNKLQVSYNNTRSQVITAEGDSAQKVNELKNAMGFPLEQTLELVASNTNTVEEQGYPLQPSEFSVQNRKDFLIAQQDIDLFALEERQIRDAAYPKLTAYARYGGNGFGQELNRLFPSITDYSAIGLKLSIPLFDGFKRHAQAAQSMYKKQNAVANLELDRQTYAMEFTNNDIRLRKARQTLDVDRQNIKLAQSVFASVDLQYQKGVTGLTDWLNAQFALKEAQSNYLNSLYNYCITGIELEKSKGTLTQFFKSL